MKILHESGLVVSDPERGFGAPCVLGTHLKACNVEGLYAAEMRPEGTFLRRDTEEVLVIVSEWYGISVDAVKACVNYIRSGGTP